MARRPRVQFPGAVYHVMSRGNRKGPIFEDDDDRTLFLAHVRDVARRYAVRFYAVCLMTNHYHAVFQTLRANLSDSMRQLNGVFTQATNRRHQRTGHLFEGRFRSIVVQRQDYLCRVVRYVALNPVRAKLVESAEHWPWSTHRMTAGLEPRAPWLATDWMPDAFGTPSLAAAQRIYGDYVARPPIPKEPTNWHLVAVGTAEFTAALEAAARLRRRDRRLPRAPITVARPSLEALFNAARNRNRRDRTIEVAHIEHGYRLSEISRHLGFSLSMASRVLRRRATPNSS